MESISVHQRLRPVRYAFMICTDDVPAAVKAVSLNSLIWGGIYNPIVPTTPEAAAQGHLNSVRSGLSR